MTFAVLRLPLLLALLALSLTEAGLALAVIVVPVLPVDPLQHTPTSKPATAAGVLVLGGILTCLWSLCAVVWRRKAKAMLQTRWELFTLFVLWVWHLGASGLLSAHHSVLAPTATDLRRALPNSDIQQSPVLPALLSSLSLVSWVAFCTLTLLGGTTATLFVRRWAAYEDSVSKLPAVRLWEDGWWGGAMIAKPARKGPLSAGEVELVPTVVVSFAPDKTASSTAKSD